MSLDSMMNQRSEADAVLTSVRQLVTQSARGAGRPVESRPAEKLLLTPALRVDGPATLNSGMPEPVAPNPVRNPSALELRIAELERAVGGSEGDWEPDGSEPGDKETPRQFVFQHTRRPEPPVEFAPQPMTELTTSDIPETAPMQGDVAVIDHHGTDSASEEDTAGSVAHVIDGIDVDEEQLREIVAQMVREELQGDLGERITHNVRKLVRREIHRALLTRDID